MNIDLMKTKSLQLILNRAKKVNEQLEILNEEIMGGKNDNIRIEIQGKLKGELDGLFFASNLSTIDWHRSTNQRR